MNNEQAWANVLTSSRLKSIRIKLSVHDLRLLFDAITVGLLTSPKKAGKEESEEEKIVATGSDILRRLTVCYDDPMWPDHCEIHKSFIARVIADIHDMKRDADRYRWLCRQDADSSIRVFVDEGGRRVQRCFDDIDAAIDAAIMNEATT